MKSLDSLYVVALRQFTTGRIGLSGLCSFIRPLLVMAVGFMLVYFHLWTLAIRVGLCFIVDIIFVRNVLVGSVAFVRKSLLRKKSSVLFHIGVWVVSLWCCLYPLLLSLPRVLLLFFVLNVLSLFLVVCCGWGSFVVVFLFVPLRVF